MTDERTDLAGIIKAHTKRYPLLQPCDIVKLIYQNEFGGGHLITDREQSLKRMREEYVAVKADPRSPAHEDIGNGMERVYLSALENEEALVELNDLFVRSAMLHKGSLKNFKRKLDILIKEFNTFGFHFSKKDLVEYLRQYEKEGDPMVSHSAVYREAYHPAYRVIEINAR